MAVQTIRLLGDPVLWTECAPVEDASAPHVVQTVADLRDTLADFRTRRGFGRGIAAPQIGALSRIVVLAWPEPLVLLNPRVVAASEERFELWDDCFSFPDLLVRVSRHRAIEVAYQDELGAPKTLSARDDLSELLQHELDHLDGVLATDRAVTPRSLSTERLSPARLCRKSCIEGL